MDERLLPRPQMGGGMWDGLTMAQAQPPQFVPRPPQAPQGDPNQPVNLYPGGGPTPEEIGGPIYAGRLYESLLKERQQGGEVARQAVYDMMKQGAIPMGVNRRGPFFHRRPLGTEGNPNYFEEDVLPGIPQS